MVGGRLVPAAQLVGMLCCWVAPPALARTFARPT